jgi:hypothetical protein
MTRILLLFVSSAIILLQSCQFTTTTSNEPVFKGQNDAVANYLASNSNCNEINIEGKQINSSDEGNRSELTIKLHYNTDMPDKAKRQGLAFNIAKKPSSRSKMQTSLMHSVCHLSKLKKTAW